ncbi:hypothetical protein [Nitratifractor sp.]|uniref:hypothetical protein n=1 Tax=Nitratifractor sp. TaxID=2268144 RepID=UPI0025E69E74|nr:hypothetical protein [Nitratifractor sp.]
MFKGFVILAIVGGLFAYFVFHFVGSIEKNDTASSYSQEQDKTEDNAKYYTKDAAGYTVLAVGKIPLAKAREVWKESTVMQDVLELFPRFELMKESIKSHVEEGPFRRYLLKKLDDIETQYLGGKIDSFKAKEMFQNL